MAQRPDLGGILAGKGEARGVSPTAVDPQPEAPPPDAVRIGKRETIPRVFTNVRIPVDLDEALYRMLVETRRTKQDVIEQFIRDGLARWWADRSI